ncbi:hypothetical protein [Mycolicibacterium celeriflavum]|uniref:hypothetical protein n=1 Tax=Mycolicibacterium celeriflavum TaxID=1249101 RepID=UPI003CEE688F
MQSRSMGITAVAGAALFLAGCDATSETQTTVTVTESAPTTQPQGEQSAPPATVPQTGTASPARPARDQCVRLDPALDGRYQVFDAGSAVVTFADGRLTLESATPAEGWTHQVDDQEAEEVEIKFRRGVEELDLELDVDKGALEVKVCNDDD